MSDNLVSVFIGDATAPLWVEFYPKPEHGAYYEKGFNGEIGSLYMPMNSDGTPDIENVSEIEVKWADG